MKYTKCVNISFGNAAGNFQVGQAGKDEFGNLFYLKGVSKEGVNIWLLVACYQQATKKLAWRFGSFGFKNDLKRMRAALKDKKPVSSFGRGKLDYKKDVRQKFYITYDRGV